MSNIINKFEKSTLIKAKNAKLVNLTTKFIRKYTSTDKGLEINHMTIKGRHPNDENQFVYETKVHFMMYLLKGKATVRCDQDTFEVNVGDVVDVPPKVKFSISGNCEYLVAQTPAWSPEQSFITDRDGNVIENSKI